VTDPGSVFNVEVTLDITHTFVGDLEAYLTSPSGRQVLLFSHDGGQYNDFHSVTFSDSAARSINTIGFNDLPYSGTWQPDGLSIGRGLSYFGGENAAGIWTLSITDLEGGDEGILNSWSLKFGSGELFRTTDASGKFQFDSLNSGNYILREELKPGWTQTPPAVTTISGATWTNLHWNATIDSLNVQNVDFGNVNVVPLTGDYNQNLVVDASDYVLWRKTLGSQVTSSSGADGDGNGIVQQADLPVWRSHFGQIYSGSGSGSGLATNAAASGAETQTVEISEQIPAATSGEPLSMEQAYLRSQVASNVATSDSAKSPIGSMQVFELLGPTSASEHDTTVIERPSESTSRSDLGLLAWLAGSSVGERPQADLISLTDDDLAASHLSDELQPRDFAFELIEGSALVLSAI